MRRGAYLLQPQIQSDAARAIASATPCCRSCNRGAGAYRGARASLAWLGAIMAPIGLIRLGQTIAEAIAGNPFPMLTPATYISVYICFTVLGLTFAVTAWRTRSAQPTHRPATHAAAS